MKNPQPEYIIIGTIVSPWGLNGQLKVEVETDFPQRFSRSSQVYIDRKPVIINDVKWHKGNAIIKLEGLDGEEAAEKLSGQVLEIHRSQLYDLPEGKYYHFQLIGLKVKTTGGEILGEVSEILSTPSADIYVIEGQNGEILIPAIADVVKSVDPDRGFLVIEPVPGLLDLNEKKPNR
jgi:16S rRNA processing protein RimM